MWEKEQNVEVGKKLNKMACLNMKCCGVVNRPY